MVVISETRTHQAVFDREEALRTSSRKGFSPITVWKSVVSSVRAMDPRPRWQAVVERRIALDAIRQISNTVGVAKIMHDVFPTAEVVIEESKNPPRQTTSARLEAVRGPWNDMPKIILVRDITVEIHRDATVVLSSDGHGMQNMRTRWGADPNFSKKSMREQIELAGQAAKQNLQRIDIR